MRLPVLVLALGFLFTLAGKAPAQINGYAKVTAISGNVLTLQGALQTYDSLKSGDRIVIMQMQGATISNTTNSSGFGSLASLGSTGLYETAFIASIDAAGTSATLTGALVNSYDPAGSLQILTYPQLGTTHYTTTSNLVAVAWNGTVGGVLAFSVNGNLVLNDNISADGMGFRGGAKAGNDGSGCLDNIWRTTAGAASAAAKGEGVYLTAAGEGAGRAKAVNGGGAGTVHNGGGGGGGNAMAGGAGFYGYAGSGCSTTVSAGGQGGLAVTSNISRVFMGGGGGGGQENNGTGTSGGNGGGIILLKADSILVAAPCFPLSISANGVAALNSGNDGAGGGGAGGTIVLDVKGIRVDSSCPLAISGNGGDGGDVGNATSHGGGGGGGQGAIFVSAAGTFSNSLFTTNPGQGGNANSSGTPKASDGSGTAGAGIQFGAGSSALDVRLSYVSAEPVDEEDVEISWKSFADSDQEYFEVYHTRDGNYWPLIGRVDCAKGDTSGTLYRLLHRQAPAGDNYYRVEQIHHADSRSYSRVVHVSVKWPANAHPYPNPCSSAFQLRCSPAEAALVRIFDHYGQDVSMHVDWVYHDELVMNVTRLPEGIYTISKGLSRYRLVIRR